MLVEQMTERLLAQRSFAGACGVILEDSVALHGAEFGNIQLAAGDRLVIAAQRGFRPSFLDFFREVRPDAGCACGRALRTGRTVVVEDTERDDEFAAYRVVARTAGFRSVTTTPLRTTGDVLIGAVSAHFVNVHRPTPIEIDTLRLYSVIAADHLHALLRAEPLAARALAMNHALLGEPCG